MVSYKLDKYDKYFVAFASEENNNQEIVEGQRVDGLFFSDQRNYMYSASNHVYCYPIEKGYIYTFYNTSNQWGSPICFTYESAGLNVPVYDVTMIEPR